MLPKFEMHSLDGLIYLIFPFLAKCFISVIIYGLTASVYRITFHPLAKYPGPFWAKITDLYSVYHAWKGDRHLEFWRCHEIYGDIVRFGPNSLSFNTTTALQTIHEHKANCTKSSFYSVFMPKGLAKSIFDTPSEQVHAFKRRVLSQAFSDKALKSTEKHMIKILETLCAKLASTNEPQDMANMSSYFTFDVMGKLAFGKSYGMLEKEDNRYVKDLIVDAAQRSLICGQMPFLFITLGLENLVFRQMAESKTRSLEYAQAQAVERTTSSSDIKDFFYYILNATDPQTGLAFTPEEVWSEANVIIVAGSDTTATALAATIFYLTHNKACLTRLVKELDMAFPPDGTGLESIRSGPRLNSCLYLRACIDEAIRMCPSVGGVLPREILPGGMVIDGQALPDGTVVGVPIYTLQHKKDLYSDPFTYQPERWLVDEVGQEAVGKARAGFCAFSLGPRGCVGKHFAYMELGIAVARLVVGFEMEIVGNIGEGGEKFGASRSRKGEFQAEDVFNSRVRGPVVKFKARKRNGLL